MNAFNEWLSTRLTILNPEVDLNIFVPYITCILEDGDEESLIEIIKEIAENNKFDFTSVSKEFVEKWNDINKSNFISIEKITKSASESLDAEMHNIIIQQNSDSAKQFSSLTIRTHASDEVRDDIVARYGDISDDDELENAESNESATKVQKSNKSIFSNLSTPLDDLLVKNTNAQQIKDREKQSREQAKQDSELKKAKDKEDKEKQRLKEVERKESEKKRTQKGERKR